MSRAIGTWRFSQASLTAGCSGQGSWRLNDDGLAFEVPCSMRRVNDAGRAGSTAAAGARTGSELAMMRWWGMPLPPRTGGPPVTNIPNTTSAHWRGWLKPENRCLVPFNSFAEYAPDPNPETKKKDVVWFALGDDRPLAAFAGIWTTFNGDRGGDRLSYHEPAHLHRSHDRVSRGHIW